MKKVTVLLYGSICYVLFLGTFLYAIGFVEGLLVPKNLNDGVAANSTLMAVLINCGLLGLFAVQHAIMARPAFKKMWTKVIPEAAERATFVLATCLCLCLMFWQWRPLPESIYTIENSTLRMVLYGISFGGWGIVLYSSFLIDHFDLFGMRQVVLYYRGIEYTNHPFMERSLYKWVRHPLMVGFLIGFWVTPDMTQGHLLFAVVTGVYILIGTMIEERDLVDILPDDYQQYRKRTPMFIPRPGRKKRIAAAQQHDAVQATS